MHPDTVGCGNGRKHRKLAPEQKAAGSNAAGGTVVGVLMVYRLTAVTLALCGLPIAPVAGPAAASPAVMDGDYQIRVDGSDFGVWTFTPDCDAGADDCTARVEAHPKGWTAVATLSEGRWSLTRASPTLFGCKDGSTSPGELRARWDAGSLSGSMLLVPEGKRCGGSDAPLRGALKLLKVP